MFCHLDYIKECPGKKNLILLPSGTSKIRFGLELARLSLGQYDEERASEVLGRCKGLMEQSFQPDPFTGQELARLDLTPEGLDIVEKYAWPTVVHEVHEMIANRFLVDVFVIE